MWTTPKQLSPEVVEFATSLACSWVGAVAVEYEAAYEHNNCHNNVALHVDLYGGTEVLGWYIVQGPGKLQAIRHSVWRNGNSLVDVTPYQDQREYIIFAQSSDQADRSSLLDCYCYHSNKKLLQRLDERMFG